MRVPRNALTSELLTNGFEAIENPKDPKQQSIRDNPNQNKRIIKELPMLLPRYRWQDG
jgi:hypothetical protein